MALGETLLSLAVLLVLFTRITYQQTSVSLQAAIDSISLPPANSLGLCSVGNETIYFKSSPLTGVSLKTNSQTVLNVVGSISSLKCSGKIVTIHTYESQSNSYRLYIYNTVTTFNKQNYVLWTTLDFEVQALPWKNVLLLVPSSDTGGSVTVASVANLDGIVASENKRESTVQVTSADLKSTIGVNADRLFLATNQATSAGISVAINADMSLQMEGDLPGFPSAAIKLLCINPGQKNAAEPDKVIVVSQSTVNKYLVQPILGDSSLDASVTPFDSSNDLIKDATIVQFDGERLILVTHVSGKVSLLNLDLQLLNYLDDQASLQSASWTAGNQLNSTSLALYFGIVNRTAPNTFDILTFTFSTCSNDCQTCLDNTRCFKHCSSGYFLLPLAGSYGDCKTTSTVTDGMGLNLETLVFEACTDVSCKRCSENRKVCNLCKTTNPTGDPAVYYLQNDQFSSENQQCLTAVPSSYGLDPSSSNNNLVKRCAVDSCVSCQQNYLECARCEGSLVSWKAPNSTTYCINISDIPSGWGINGSNAAIVSACSIPDCDQCQSNHSKCQGCTSSSGKWVKLSSSSDSCEDPNIQLDYFGKSSSNSSIIPCKDSQCKNCFTSWDQCETCKPPAEVSNTQLYLGNVQGNYKCLESTNIPQGFFVDNSAFTFTTCDVSNCLNCSANKASCSKCSVGTYLYFNLSQVTCLAVQQVQLLTGNDRKFGINGLQFSACSANCLECFNNHQICTLCDAGFSLMGNSSQKTCKNISSITQGYGVNSTSGQLEPCSEPLCVNCSLDNSVCFNCSTSSYFYYLNESLNPSPVGCAKSASVPAGYGKVTTSSQMILKKCSSNATDNIYCVDCSSNFEKCTSCIAPYLVQPFENDTNAGCVTFSNILEGFGKNMSAPFDSVTRCQASNCRLCSADHTQCTTCFSGYYLDATLKKKNNIPTCQNLTSIQTDADYASAGVNNVSMTILPCSASCSNCTFDSNGCTACANSLYLLLQNNSFTCQNSTYVITHPGLGLPPAGVTEKTIKACMPTNCKTCPSDYSSCESCNTGYYLYQPQTSPSNKMCSGPNLANFPDFYGIVPAASPAKISPCSVNGCAANGCKLNNSFCSSCDNQFQIQMVNQHTNYCVNKTSSAPDGYGIDPTNTSRLLPCALTSSGCSKCSLNYLVCEACSSGLFLNMTDPSSSLNLCLNDSPINGFGKDLSIAGTIRRCHDLNCDMCHDNYLECSSCSSTFLLDKISLPGVIRCLPADQFTLGAGKNGSDLAFCSIQGCQDCFDNFTNCLECREEFTKNPNYIQGLPYCVPFDDLPAGYGADNDGTLQACSDPSCHTCKNSTLCTHCLTGWFLNASGICENCPTGCSSCQNRSHCETCSVGYYLDGSTSPPTVFCSSTTDPGFGINLETGTIEACSDSECSICSSNFRNCSTCKPNFKLLLNSSGGGQPWGTCITGNQAINGFGLDSTTSNYLNCLVSNCVDCWANFSFCSNCSSSNSLGYYLNNHNGSNSCLVNSSIPTAFGIKWSTLTVEPCQIENCAKCFDDFEDCSKCATNYSLVIDPDGSKSCQAAIEPGFGIDPATGNVHICQNRYCKNCTDNYQKCQACYYGYFGLWEDSPDDINCQPLALGTALGPSLADLNHTSNFSTSKLRPCTDTDKCLDCSLNYLACQQCKPEYHYYPVTPPTLQFNYVFTRYLRHAVFYTCLAPSDAWPYAFGKDVIGGTMELKPCLNSCVSCKNDYSVCEQCKVTEFTSVQGQCVSSESLASLTGQGIDRWPNNGTIKTQMLRACKDTNCSKCTDNADICYECGLGYFLDQVASSCLRPQDLIGLSKGPDLSTTQKIITNCLDGNCLSCPNDFTKCISCKPQLFYFNDTSTGNMKCFTLASLQAANLSLGPKQDQSLELTNCIPECSSCLSLFTKCDNCTDNSNYLVPDGPSPNCVPFLDLEISNSSGINLASKVVVPCSSSLCDLCWFNFQLCNLCRASFYLNPQLPFGQSACLESDTIPSGFGKVLSSNPTYTASCIMDGCSNCSEDNSKCSTCQAGLYAQLSDQGSITVCHRELTTIPLTYGIKAGTNILERCQEGCLNCTLDYMSCSRCLENYFFFNDSCFASSAVPPLGYGKDLIGQFYKYSPCEDTQNCLNCANNFRFCQVCKPNFRLNEMGICELIDSSADGYGLNGSNLVPCAIQNCKNCSENYEICSVCSFGFIGQVQNSLISSCVDVLNITTGFGLINDTLMVPCQVKNCEICTYDALACEFCANRYYLYSSDSNTSCLAEAEIPLKLGIKDYIVEPCQISGCKNCSSNSSFCFNCSEGYYLDGYQNDRKCINNSHPVDTKTLSQSVKNDGLQDQISDRNTGSNLLKFNVTIKDIKKSDLVFRGFDSSSGSIYSDMTVREYKILDEGHSLQVRFNFNRSVSKAKVLIFSRNSQSNLLSTAYLSRRILQNSGTSTSNPFDNGVLVNDVEYYDSDSDWLKVVGLVINIILMVISFATYLKQPIFCYRITETAIVIGMVNLWSSNKPMALTQFVYYFRYSMFNVIPFVSVSEDYIACSASGPIHFNEYSCFIYNNLARYIPTFFVWLLVTYGASFLFNYFFANKLTSLGAKLEYEITKRDYSRQTLKANSLNFSLAVITPFFYFATVNLYYMNTSIAMKYGFFLSLVVMIFYVILLGIGIYQVRNLQTMPTRDDPDLLMCLTEGIKFDETTKPIVKYTRIIELLRNVFFGVLLAFLNDFSLTQSIVALIVTLPFFIYLLVFKVFDIEVLKSYYLAKEFMFILLAIFLIVTSSNTISASARQQGVGFCQTTITLGIAVAGIYFGVHSFFAKTHKNSVANSNAK